jgi:hypothetical protein
MVHVEPFHDSASDVCPPATVSWLPTATHDPAEGHDTDTRSLVSTPGAFGVAVNDHVPPLHASANVPANEPTETQVVAVPQETALSIAVTNGGPTGGGVGWSCHDEPLNRSTITPSCDHPTAVHADTLEQERPVI